MTIQPKANLYTQGFGSRPENVEVPHITTRAPSTSDILYPIGKRWINTVGNSEYTLTSLLTVNSTTTATWVATGGGTVDLSTLTGDTGTATPVAGNIKIAGTANQITTAASGSTVTLSLPAAITTPGSLTTTTTLTAGTSITATLGNITATNGNLVLSTAGNKLLIAATSSATCSAGTFALGGTATTVVSNSAVTANSLIYLTTQALGTVTVASTLAVTARLPGVSFTVTSSQSTDTSTIAYLIIN